MYFLPQKLKEAIGFYPSLICPPLLRALLSHTWIEDKKTKTIFVAKGNIYYNPDFVEKSTSSELQDIIFIEALRILLAHPYRLSNPDPKNAYMSSLITLGELIRPKSVTGSGLVTESLSLPTAAEVFNSQDHNLKNLEYYYNLLYSQTEQVDEDQVSEKYSNGSEQLQEYIKEGLARADEWMQDNIIKNKVEQIVNESNANRAWGSDSGTLTKLFEIAGKVDVDYVSALRKFKVSIMSSDRTQTRMRPSRRYGLSQLGWRTNYHAKLLVAVDCSGSMADDDIQVGMGAIDKIFKHGISEVDVVCWDTDIKGNPQKITKRNRKFEVTGRGGTDVQCVIDLMNKSNYDGVIIFTDGYFSTPENCNSNKIIWLFNSKQNYDNLHQNLDKLGTCVYIK